MTDLSDSLARARATKAAHEAELMARPNVVGVGVGLIQRRGKPTGEIGIIVMVQRKVPRAQLSEADVVPHEIEGVAVDVQEVGELRAG